MFTSCVPHQHSPPLEAEGKKTGAATADGIIHDQRARRMETVSLRLRFLHDYVVFDF